MKNIIFNLLLLSCFAWGNNQNEDKLMTSTCERSIKVVFFNFSDKKVTLKINNKIVLDEILTVTIPSTGLSLIREFFVKKNNKFELSFDDKVIKENIQIDNSIKLIYINPNIEPYISLSRSEIILLD